MSCSRPQCGSIMCDDYVNLIGYVCSDCQKEFKKFLKAKNLNPETDSEIQELLIEFMETNKGKYEIGNRCSVDDFFKNRY